MQRVEDALTTDMTGGLYRRIYAGFLTGRRINSVSIGAEAWFWRMHAIADDFGNLHGDPHLLKCMAAPRRDVKLGDIEAWITELMSTDPPLIRGYEVDGERFIEIDQFTTRQPAGRNGKRIKKVPLREKGNPEKSWGILGNPVQSGNSKHTIPIPIPIPIPKTKTTKAVSRVPKADTTKALDDLPQDFQTDAFREAWSAWVDSRLETRHPLTANAARIAKRKCVTWGVAKAIESLNASTIGGWQGLFEPKENQSGNRNIPTPNRVQAPPGKYANVGIEVPASRPPPGRDDDRPGVAAAG